MQLPNIERAVMEVYGGCDYKCKMCPQSSEEGRGDNWVKKMPLDIFKNVLDQLPGKPIINLEGSGEALLVNNLPEYIQACTDRNFDTYVYTNGNNLSGQYMHDIIDAGLTFIRVSCTGYNQEVFKEWTGIDNFEKVRNNIKETKEYIDSNNRRCELSSYHLIIDENNLEHEVQQYKTNYIEYCGVTGYIWKMHNWSGNYSPDYVRDNSKRKSCGRPFAPEITIRAGGLNGLHGAVTPCCQTMGYPNEDKSVLGHAETETLEQIWYGEKYEELRRLHAAKEFDKIEYCKDCDFLYDDPSVLVWSNDPDAKPNWILGTNFLLSDCTNLK